MSTLPNSILYVFLIAGVVLFAGAGNTRSNRFVAPTVNVEAVNPKSLTLKCGEEGIIAVSVSTSTDVPVNTIVEIGMYEAGPAPFGYSVLPNRTISFVVDRPGWATLQHFTVRIDSKPLDGAKSPLPTN